MNVFRFALVGALLAAASAVGAAAQDGKGVELHPKVERLPHAHMGPFVRRKDGAIVAVDGTKSLVSRDEGKTWEEAPLFAPDQQPPLNVRGERAIVQTESGAIIVSFINDREKKWTWKNELKDAPGAILPAYAMRSLDGGKTWQDITKLHDEWTGAVRDMIQTKDGLVMIAAQKLLNNPGRHATVTYWSDDDGKTWHPSNVIDLGGSGHHGGNMEPTFVQLKDGRVWMLIRTNWGEFWSAWSYDGGKTWRVLQPSGIVAGSAPAIVKRLESGRLALLWNPPYPEGKDSFPLTGGDGLWSDVPVSNHRAELALAFSSDEGKTWSKPTIIARQPDKWLSYPYLFEVEPGRLWVTTMQGDVRAELREADFVKE